MRSPGGSVVKSLPAKAGDMGSNPRSGRAPGGGNGSPLHILAWKHPWTEEPGGLQSRSHKESDTTEHTNPANKHRPFKGLTKLFCLKA